MAGLVNKVIGGFKVLEEIKGGSGSQGSVCRAVCEKPVFPSVPVGAVVALKTMPVNDEDGRIFEKLRKRTDQLARLVHPNVVRYHGCFSEQGLFSEIHVVVQDFLDGETLHQRLERCPGGLDVDEALRICDAALAGLEYTSRAGIVHRDVKPGNVFLCRDGSVKLIDFEIALREGGTVTSSSSNFAGSFDYMSPDFTNAKFRGDVRSDVFSMGVVLHELLTGKTPYQRFEGDDKQANFAFLQRWARAAEGVSPIRVSSRVKRLVAHADEVLVQALALDPLKRFPDFTAFRAGLKTIRCRDLRNGEKVYRMLQLVGKGGFGEVFKARDRRTGRAVAIKHLLKAAYAERFYREAKIMAQLRDPCFVQFIDFFVIDNAGAREAFLVMDYLDGMPGSSLRDAIRRRVGKGMPVHEVLGAFARFAHGLHVMHRRGIFHRDIKPSNLYYPEDRLANAAIMDLGIARDVNGTATTGQVPGTLDYMPPEVVMESSRGDAGMDIYALGLCLYEALTGKLGYPRLPTGPTALAAFFARAKEMKPPRLDDPIVVRDRELAVLLADMTNPHADKRLKDAAQLERTLLALAAKHRPADAPTPAPESETATVSEEPATEDAPFQPAAAAPARVGDTVAVPDGTVATRVVTAATTPVGGEMSAIMLEKAALARRRREKTLAALKKVFIVVAVLGGLAAAGFLLRAPIGGLAAKVVAGKAAREVDEALDAWAQSEAGGLGKDAAWYAKWNPAVGTWPRLADSVWTANSNRLAMGWVDIAKRRREAAEIRARQDAERQKAETERHARAEKAAQAQQAKIAAEEAARKAAAEKMKAEREKRLARLQSDFKAAATEKDAFMKAYADEKSDKASIDVRVAGWKQKWGQILAEMPDEWMRLKADVDGAEATRRGIEDRRRFSREERQILDECRKHLKAVESVAAGTVKNWRENVKRARDFLSVQVKRGKVSEDARVQLENEIRQRSEWIVGVVENKTEATLLVAGCEVKPLTAATLVFKEGLASDAQILAAGFEPIRRLSREGFDANVVTVLPSDLRAKPGEVIVPELGADVVCLIDGRAAVAGVTKISSGERHLLKYRNRRSSYGGKADFSDQEFVFRVKAGERVELPPPGEWKETESFKKSVTDAKLAQRGKGIVDSVRQLLVAEPIADRRSRLAKAYKILNDWKTPEALAALDVQAERRLKEEYDRECRRVIGEVRNDTAHELRVKVYEGGVTISPGGTARIAFDEGWPRDRVIATATGYDPVLLPGASGDFDGHLVVIGESQLKPSPVAVTVPALEPGVTFRVDRQVVSGTTLPLEPGLHVVEYAKNDCLDQKIDFSVKIGEKRTLPAPGTWQPTEGAAAFTAALAKFTAGSYDEVKGLLDGVPALENPESRRKLQEMKESIKIREKLHKHVEDAEFYFENREWRQVVACYAQARRGGYALSAEDMRNLKTAFGNYSKSNVERREAVKAKNQVDWQSIVEKMESDLQEVKNLYDAAMER